MHRASALELPQGANIEEEIKNCLSPSLREWAKKRSSVDFQTEAVPAWLRSSPSLPVGRESFVDLKVPLDRAAARLVERYGLPWAAFDPIRFYVLTLRRDALSRVPSLDVLVQPTDSALQVTVEGLDEFTTKEEWNGIWDRHLAFRLQARWQERGQAPKGKRAPDLQRLKDGLPLYRLVRVEKLSYNKALDRLAAEEKTMDASTAWGLVRDLRRILEPRDDGSGAGEARV